jgi:hypothetical protein
MKRTSLISLSTLILGTLFTFAAQAQAPQKPAAESAPVAATPGPGQEPDPKIIEGIMQCLGEGLPEGWQKTWFVISETGRSTEGTTRQFEAKFFYATDPKDAKGKPLAPCGGTRVIDHVIALNDYLQPSQRRWTGVTMTFMIDGSYSANYDYTVRKPAPAAAPAKAAAKPAAKKKQEAAK